ncbi:hypothetical protein J6590_003609 [Homalodisca vitripennis]|nr:hypothetical protein J6590_003609 [Homalodisca vitripennis]
MDEARAFATSFGSVNMMSFTLKPRIGRGGCFPQTAFSLLHTRDKGVVRLIEEVNSFHEFRRHLLNMRRVLALARRKRARFSSVGDLLNIRKAFLPSRSDILHSSVHQGLWGTLPGISRTLIMTGMHGRYRKGQRKLTSRSGKQFVVCTRLGLILTRNLFSGKDKLASHRSIKQDSDHQGPWKPCCPLESK